MLKVDKQRIEGLISTSDADRIVAAKQLDALPHGHFENHRISSAFVKQREKKLLSAYRETQSSLVREWVLQILAVALIDTDDVIKIASEALTTDCRYLPTLLYYVWRSAPKFAHCKEKIKSLYQHPDVEVRWRSALVLEKLPLEYKSDIAVIRTLMTDDYHTTRTYAVLALKKLGRIEALDRIALERVVRLDDGAARTYATELLGRREF
ncbi:MAG TPA: hypothetical protein VKA50_13920 [Gammaproteobacteria bacterium]|nr:hypothetical protein [Gammaproteobacteria bacterium]